MTPEERTGKILDILKAFRREWTISETLKRLESEIINPAIEEERAACAKIADDLEFKQAFCYWQVVADEIAEQIRARLDAKPD